MAELQYEPIQQRTSRYWESEKPVTTVTERNVLSYFPKAKKLQVSQPNWTDSYGELKRGKTVTLDLDCPDALNLIQEIAKSIPTAE